MTRKEFDSLLPGDRVQLSKNLYKNTHGGDETYGKNEFTIVKREGSYSYHASSYNGKKVTISIADSWTHITAERSCVTYDIDGEEII